MHFKKYFKYLILSSFIIVVIFFLLPDFIKNDLKFIYTSFNQSTVVNKDLFNLKYNHMILWLKIIIYLLALCSFGFFIYKIKNLESFKNCYSIFLKLIFVFVLLFIFWMSITRSFDRDENEHIHSAWYITKGAIPYKDFFQHHHPMLWYSTAPIILCFGETIKSIIIIKFFIFLCCVSIFGITYKIAKEVFESVEIGLASILFLGSSVMFVEKVVEVRPDVPQTLFGLISVFFMLRFLKNQNKKNIIASGFFASISFMFLQKSLFLLIAYAIIFFYKLLRKEISLKHVSFFVLSFFIPLIPFFLYFIFNNSFHDYFFNNWILNMHLLKSFSPYVFMSQNFEWNLVLWYIIKIGLSWIVVRNYKNIFIKLTIYIILLSLAFMKIEWWLILSGLNCFVNFKNEDSRLKMLIFIGIALFGSSYVISQPFKQYFMFPMPFFCITASYFLINIFNKFNVYKILRVIIIILIIKYPIWLLIPESKILNHSNFKKIKYILNNTQSNDYVYDTEPKFNLFRNDLHYFWYSTGKNRNMDSYNKLINSKYRDYNLYDLIKKLKPKFIGDRGINVQKNGLDQLYQKTSDPHLFVRKESL